MRNPITPHGFAIRLQSLPSFPVLGLMVVTALAATGRCGDFNLFNGRDLSGWRQPTGAWQAAKRVAPWDNDPKKFTLVPGAGVLVNGSLGKTRNLLTEAQFGDVEAHVEFMVPKSSNSGVYFQGRYEIQVFDSWGAAQPKYSDCGGIYQRYHEKEKRGYEGHPPRVNASHAPGHWQTFDVLFRAPRFDASGRKIENARFLKVIHTGRVIHENVEVTGPTRAAAFGDEQPAGPLMLQGDHGPVAYRNITLKPLVLP